MKNRIRNALYMSMLALSVIPQSVCWAQDSDAGGSQVGDVIVGVVASAATGGPVLTVANSLADCQVSCFGATAIAAAQDTADSFSAAGSAIADGNVVGAAVNLADGAMNACETVVDGACEIVNGATLGLAGKGASLVADGASWLGGAIGSIFD